MVISASALELYCTDCRYTLFLLKDVLVNVPSHKLQLSVSESRTQPSHNMISCLIIRDIYMSGSHTKKFCSLASNIHQILIFYMEHIGFIALRAFCSKLEDVEMICTFFCLIIMHTVS